MGDSPCLALWNGKDPILKERLFGLTNGEGNHGEDVKEYYFYLDSTPTHSYMKYLYKYPQAAYPYDDLVTTNGRRTREEMEYELFDTGVDANIVLLEPNRFVELQGTAEHGTFSREEFDHLLVHAERGIGELFALQRRTLDW